MNKLSHWKVTTDITLCTRNFSFRPPWDAKQFFTRNSFSVIVHCLHQYNVPDIFPLIFGNNRNSSRLANEQIKISISNTIFVAITAYEYLMRKEMYMTFDIVSFFRAFQCYAQPNIFWFSLFLFTNNSMTNKHRQIQTKQLCEVDKMIDVVWLTSDIAEIACPR